MNIDSFDGFVPGNERNCHQVAISNAGLRPDKSRTDSEGLMWPVDLYITLLGQCPVRILYPFGTVKGFRRRHPIGIFIIGVEESRTRGHLFTLAHGSFYNIRDTDLSKPVAKVFEVDCLALWCRFSVRFD